MKDGMIQISEKGSIRLPCGKKGEKVSLTVTNEDTLKIEKL